ncbi:MAG: hypothetical protein U0Y96_07535 [Candidatus Kapaibacterium sp.]|nr:hypothetical protein [Bacteroidota bacterium]
MFKIILLVVFFFLGINLHANQESKDKVSIENITIYYTDFQNETFANVSCNDFKSEFFLDLKSIIIYNQKIIADIIMLIKKLEPDTAYEEIDARAKIEITYSYLKKDVLCIDMFTTMLNGQQMKNDEGLIKKIRDIVYQHSRKRKHRIR